MKKLISVVLVIVLCFTLTGFSQVMQTDDSVVFEQAIEQLRHINSRGSVESAYELLKGITSNYNQANMYALYASMILDIYDEDFDRAEIILNVLSSESGFASKLGELGIYTCEDLSKYIEARRLEAGQRYDEALALYSSINVLDSLDRRVDIMINYKDRMYSSAQALYAAGEYYKAALAFNELGKYKDSEQKYAEALDMHSKNHKFSKPTCTEWAVCEECGATGAPSLGHDWKDATCTEPRTCRRCGAMEGEPLGHVWKDATCTESGVCTRCYSIGTDPMGHDWTEATCTEPKTCKRCGVTEGKPLDHDWLEATYKNPETCSKCGATKGRQLSPRLTIGSVVTLGHYEQDCDTSNGPEPIEWIVLENQEDKALLISKYVIDYLGSHSKSYAYYSADEWKDTYEREWLNDSFINKVFGVEEQSIIITTEVDTSAHNWGHTTQDKIFLLSDSEAERYFGSDGARKCVPTAYTLSKGNVSGNVYTSDGLVTSGWLLRSQGGRSVNYQVGDTIVYYESYRQYIGENGSIQNHYDGGMRPALWIDIELFNALESDVDLVASESQASGLVVEYGSYQQRDYESRDKIKWIILTKNEDGAYLLISKLAIDCKKYDNNGKATDWEHCTLRAWLNDDFMKEAFTEEEKSSIMTITVDNSPVQGPWGKYGGNNTQDKVFLLSNYESMLYSQYLTDFKVTSYAKTHGAETISRNSYGGTYYGSWWWLRSPGKYKNDVTIVKYDDSRDSVQPNEQGGCVRPAMWVYIDNV